ncbi:hypothetical protein ABH925_007109 [Streptacidiphilus sp. EB129]
MLAVAIALGATSLLDAEGPAGPPGRAVQESGLGLHAAPSLVGDRRQGPDEDREGPGAGASARVEPDRASARWLPLAECYGQAPDRVDRDRHRRHDHHLGVQEGRGSGDFQADVWLSPAGRVVPEHPGMPGHAAARGQRRRQHGHRSPARPGRRPRQVPDSSAAKILIRIDGAVATHDLLDHLEVLNTTRRTVRYLVGWKLTDADERHRSAAGRRVVRHPGPGRHRRPHRAHRRTHRPEHPPRLARRHSPAGPPHPTLGCSTT